MWKNGILNDAILIMGDELLLDLASENNVSKNVLNYSYGMLVKAMDYNYRIKTSPIIGSLSNCTVIMIGPAIYEESLLSFDMDACQYLYNKKQKVYLHHCGKFDHFIPSYRRIPHVDSLLIGFESNVKAALEAFPEAHVDYFFDTYLLINGSRNEIIDKTNEILESAQGNWDRFSITIPDIDYGSLDENLLEVYECCKKAI